MKIKSPLTKKLTPFEYGVGNTARNLIRNGEMMKDQFEIIQENLNRVREQIAGALQKSARAASPPDAVRLVAVSKYTDPQDGLIDLLFKAGCHDFGEARPQMLLEKAEIHRTKGHSLHWHFIGPLQRNKIRKILPAVSLLHSVDSVKLAESLERIVSEEHLMPVNALLEVNISGDAAKQGFSPDSFPAALDSIARFPHVRFHGFMCMSGLNSDTAAARRQFAAVRELAERMTPYAPDNCRFDELSMGMSGDLEAAILEGATLVRIGSALFNGLLW
ncbi:MAG: YggS family pyridoxal phosphate-dependent enzyme [Planctomycetaceae bacterium]|jgi:pyridoxal phosphate enzyme (YggS family)|nr:YggS family pyridoxal phosphate-dependent enzyme [Planctomycetaceae bacterium]